MITEQEIVDRFADCNYDWKSSPTGHLNLDAAQRGDIILIINLPGKHQFVGRLFKEKFPTLLEMFP